MGAHCSTMLRTAAVFALVVACAFAHDAALPINPDLGVPGYPSCTRPGGLNETLSVDEAAMALQCYQEGNGDDTIKIGCVGDSITAGVCSTGGNHTYPGQLQIMLDQAHGPGKYSVTNLGACGSTMLKKGNSPFWTRPQYNTLTSNKWDIIVIMLGTNDAKDPSDHGPNNWQHDCGGPEHTTLTGCSFASDYADMIKLVKTLGTTAAGPKIYTQTAPPLMATGAYGMNRTVINAVYPKLIPLINKANNVNTEVIDVFSGMGGTPDWATKAPDGCTLENAKSFAPCGWWCDAQHCDQCHPNNNGYIQLASIVKKGLGL